MNSKLNHTIFCRYLKNQLICVVDAVRNGPIPQTEVLSKQVLVPRVGVPIAKWKTKRSGSDECLGRNSASPRMENSEVRIGDECPNSRLLLGVTALDEASGSSSGWGRWDKRRGQGSRERPWKASIVICTKMVLHFLIKNKGMDVSCKGRQHWRLLLYTQ